MDIKFVQQLQDDNLTENTISSYLFSIKHYFSLFEIMNKSNLLSYKGFLMEHYKPTSVNLKIQAINKYLIFIKKDTLKLKFIKIQRKNFLENVISYPDYLYFINCLKKDRNMMWYFIVRFLGATGARVSELINIKVEHITVGYIDLYTKGGKIRRIYIPIVLKQETLKWLNDNNNCYGYLFKNRFDNKITTRGLAHQLKKYANDYDMDITKVYPHSFRHMFAKRFLEINQDIALLADLLGHESIETTRIYLRRTSEEQHQIVNEIVTW